MERIKLSSNINAMLKFNQTPRILFITLSLLYLLFFIARPGWAQHKVKHPQERFIPYLSQFGKNNVTLIAKSHSDNSELGRKLANAVKLYKIGKKRGTTHEIFGLIVAAVTDKEGNLYALDRKKETVVVYDSTGKYLYHFGRRGRGPGEFSTPSDMKMDKQGNIYVADRLYSIHKFSKKSGRYTYVKDIKIKEIPDAFCIMNKKYMYGA